MSTELNSDSSTDQEQTAQSPGDYLRSQRELKGYSQKEVADKLHITVHYVNAIENDAYEKLPGIIFAKGYMKRYGEILELNPDEISDRFDEFQQAEQEHQKEVTRISRKKHQARNRSLALVSIVFFAGIFAGLWAWNTSMQASSNTANEVAALEQTTPVANRTVAEPAIPSTVQDSSTLPAQQPGREIALEAEPEIQDIGATPAVADEFDSVAAVEPEPTDTRIVTITNEGNDVLRVSFTDESFIQVSDEDANRLYRGTLGAGDVLEIRDSAPFNILLGDAPLTRLTLNGDEIDVSDSIRIDNSARLTVGL
ncbi:MAG: DUF4115 domain-containing protein [Pseudomonadales bacterium]|nr:DUF4115 domain-containing protein [Pseudomonadales bacterium]